MEEPTELDRQKQAWVRDLRRSFCRRPAQFPETEHMLDDHGDLNKEYFQVRPAGSTRWTEDERKLLVEGIQTYGIGRFQEMTDHLLPSWSPKILRIKTMRLIGTRDLRMYLGWKGDEKLIQEEYERNKRMAKSKEAWASGVHNAKLKEQMMSYFSRKQDSKADPPSVTDSETASADSESTATRKRRKA